MENKNLETMVAGAVEDTTQPVELTKVLDAYYVTVKDGNVDSNIGYVKQVLEQKCEELSNMIYSGTKKDQLAMIKKDRAEVNKFQEAVKKQKTAVRKDLLKPFSDFEKDANEAIEMAKRTSDHLNESAAIIEEEFRQEKRIKIREVYDKIKEPVGDYADEFYSMIYQNSWENASTTMAQVKRELQEKIDSYATGMNTLEMMMCEEDIKEVAIDLFKKDLDIASAIQYINAETKARTEAKAREEARIAAEKARIEAEARAAIEAERSRAEAEKQAAIEAERSRAEAEKQAAIEAERSRAEETMSNAAVPEQCDEVVAESSKNNARICVEFLNGDDWKAVKEYCDLHAIFYSVK